VSAKEDVSPQRRQLGEALRRLRLDADLTGTQLANQAGWAQSKVSRIERGQSAVAVADVELWAQICHAPDDVRGELVELAEAVATEATAWRRALRRGLPRMQREVGDLEAGATTLLYYQPVLVPGLLQTPEYARQVATAGALPDSPDVAGWIAARMDRQAILYEPSRRIELVIGEPALRWRLGPAHTMLAQLDRIVTVTRLPNVAVRIIPLSAEVPVWHTHGFTIYDGRDDGPIVAVSTMTAGLTITDPHDVGRYRAAFDRLRELAVFGDAARAVLDRAMQELLASQP